MKTDAVIGTILVVVSLAILPNLISDSSKLIQQRSEQSK